MTAERTARQLEALAMHRLAAGDRDGAARLLRRAILLHRTPTGLALYAAVAGSDALRAAPVDA
jgi:hypothetical protein